MPMSTIVTGRQEDVTAPAWPVPEERRLVSVLFADIVGSTALTERLDPEDVRALQLAYFDTVAGVLRRWQGVVEKYVGDAVMALFGARRSDGLDAYRAVRAGLEIQGALDRRPMPGGVRLRVRVGVATGEAVVDLAAARDGGHGAASGTVTTTAARLQEYAPAGGVVVCAATHRATAGLVEQHALAPAALAGKALPVDVWRARAACRPRPARHDGPLVGRRRELATAREQLVRAVREQRPRWVSLVGPDGIGRSRLLHELRRTLRQVDGVSVRWCVAHCPPYPEAALAPVADLVGDLAGACEGDAPAVLRRRLAALVGGVLPPARAATAVGALAGLLAGAGRTADGAAACREVLLALAARQPVVVAVDDLDRAAPELGRFLHTLFAAATVRGLPLAVLVTHRPHWADLLPGPADRRCRVTLPPLPALDSGRLVRRMLARAGQPAALAARLLPLVAGVPGYATGYVAEAGRGAVVAEPPLPEAVRRVAGARLDRLDGVGRAVLMAGATLGGPLTAAAVDRLLCWTPGRAADILCRLAADGLLRPDPRGRYAFVDPALRRVAYERLPRAVRAEFVRRAGGCGSPVVAGAPTCDGTGPARPGTPTRSVVRTDPDTAPTGPDAGSASTGRRHGGAAGDTVGTDRDRSTGSPAQGGAPDPHASILQVGSFRPAGSPARRRSARVAVERPALAVVPAADLAAGRGRQSRSDSTPPLCAA
ncbi:adenylate/guanylate cyclase domain-containing protein [Micromonospora sp. KC723]|uniref:adenylate/guanylate cyclase domain-containing protein n=1 Tax=Micromonospora sp. KC723 TaxID=2530381 RepID=UPI001FB5F79C|nr:adenylate/guanylate cyclase domain-containing protein [Micromonospora sp. KC723]